jgi:cysteinyl-tRNA synthetase
MAGKYLGAAFDIHGGGVDLRFPHHENEQAQSRAAGLSFASYWMHNAWITTAGEKMSKSLGNSLLVPNVLERVRGIELRYYMVAAHYRSSVEFSFEALEEAAAGFTRIERFVSQYPDVAGDLPKDFVDAMDDDLGTPAAVAVIHEHVREGNVAVSSRDEAAASNIAGQVRAMLRVLGLDPRDFPEKNKGDQRFDAAMAWVIRAREDARNARNWAMSDQIRDEMRAAGVLIEDTPDGPRWSV